MVDSAVLRRDSAGSGPDGAPPAFEPSIPPALRPPPGHPRFPLFDSLRALAAICILLIHVGIFTGVFTGSWYQPLVAHLDIGVTLFFLLSGFLLYRPFVAARVLGAPATEGRVYARRRFLRIAPAYWAALTVVAIVPGMYGIFTGDWWVYYGLLQSFPLHQISGRCATPDFIHCGIPPTWTLAIEVLFYAVLPFFALGMARLTRGRLGGRWFGIELAVLGLIGLVSVFIQARGVSSDLNQWLFYSPLGRGWWFGLGMALAVTSVRNAQRKSDGGVVGWLKDHPGAPWALAAVLYLGMSLFWLEPGPSLSVRAGISRTEYLGEYVLVGLIGLLILLPAVFESESRSVPRRVLSHPVLAWLGLVSYGIFLYHYPVLVGLLEIGVLDWWPRMAFVVAAIATFAITVVCAALSYYLLERPLMRRK